VRKSLLESLEIICPPLIEQEKLMQAVDCWSEQQKVIQAISDNHQKVMAGIDNNVLNKTRG